MRKGVYFIFADYMVECCRQKRVSVLFLHQTNVKSKKSYPCLPGLLDRGCGLHHLMTTLKVKIVFVQLPKQPENVSSLVFKTSFSFGYLNLCNYPSPTSFTAIYPAAEGNEMG